MQNCTGNQPDINPFLAVTGISPYWKHLKSTNPDLWQVPEGLFLDLWEKGLFMTPIQMGRGGTCTTGMIQPDFFLLPRSQGDTLGVPIYDDLKC